MNPERELLFRQPLRRTPFHDRFVELSTTEEWMAWNGYKVARVVDKLSTEYFAVRSGCAVMDLTPMEKYRVTGPGARAYLDRLVARDISALRPGRVTYVIDKQGIVRHVFSAQFLADRHVKEALEVIRELG